MKKETRVIRKVLNELLKKLAFNCLITQVNRKKVDTETPHLLTELSMSKKRLLLKYKRLVEVVEEVFHQSRSTTGRHF